LIEEDHPVSYALVTKNGPAIVNIKVTGVGIKPEILPTLFSKFVTKASGGTGVGLFISKNIVKAHGGKICAGNNSNAKKFFQWHKC